MRCSERPGRAPLQARVEGRRQGTRGSGGRRGEAIAQQVHAQTQGSRWEREQERRGAEHASPSLPLRGQRPGTRQGRRGRHEGRPLSRRHWGRPHRLKMPLVAAGTQTCLRRLPTPRTRTTRTTKTTKRMTRVHTLARGVRHWHRPAKSQPGGAPLQRRPLQPQDQGLSRRAFDLPLSWLLPSTGGGPRPSRQQPSLPGQLRGWPIQEQGRRLPRLSLRPTRQTRACSSTQKWQTESRRGTNPQVRVARRQPLQYTRCMRAGWRCGQTALPRSGRGLPSAVAPARIPSCLHRMAARKARNGTKAEGATPIRPLSLARSCRGVCGAQACGSRRQSATDRQRCGHLPRVICT